MDMHMCISIHTRIDMSIPVFHIFISIRTFNICLCTNKGIIYIDIHMYKYILCIYPGMNPYFSYTIMTQHIYLYMYTQKYMHICIYIGNCTYMYVHIYIHMSMCKYLSMCIHLYVYICIDLFINMYMNVKNSLYKSILIYETLKKILISKQTRKLQIWYCVVSLQIQSNTYVQYVYMQI